MKSSIFWDITACSRLKVNRCLGGTLRSARYLFHVGFLLGLFFDPEGGGDIPPKRRLTFNVLHDVISQNIDLFVTTAVGTSHNTEAVLTC
jgi:hypothetical protein